MTWLDEPTLRTVLEVFGADMNRLEFWKWLVDHGRDPDGSEDRHSDRSVVREVQDVSWTDSQPSSN